MDGISEQMKQHYSQTFEKYGANTHGVDWGGKIDDGKLEMRYSKMLEAAMHVKIRKTSFSVLDVGCGYGGLYEYAVKNGYLVDYTGIDLCNNMINYALDNQGGGVILFAGIYLNMNQIGSSTL